MRRLPKKLKGVSKEAAWHNELIDYLLQAHLTDSPDIIVERTTSGTRLRIKAKSKNIQGGGGTPVWQ